MTNHVLTRFDSHAPTLTRDAIRKAAPSAFASMPANHVSEKYNFVETTRILDIMESEGWDCIGAMQTKVRKPESLEVTKHQLILRNRGFNPELISIGGVIPVVRVVNSHNWSSRLKIILGLFRFICSNGAVIGHEMASFTVRHDHIFEDMNTIIARFNSGAMRTLETAQRWAQIALTFQQIDMMAMAAARIRFGDSATSEHAASLLTVRRQQDAGDSLWNVFNRIQENAIKGGIRINGVRRATRAIRNIDSDLDINQSLWNVANEFDSRPMI